MKKVLKSLSILAILFLLTLGAAANEQIHVYLDGKELSFDTPPIIIDDNTLVPMRAVFEALGAEVKWDGDKQCVTANRRDTEIKLFVGQNGVYRDSVYKDTPCPSQLINDRVYVPVRAIAESFGCHVDWSEQSQAVVIFTEGMFDRICASMEFLVSLTSNGYAPFGYIGNYAIFLEIGAETNDLSKVKLLIPAEFTEYNDITDSENCMRGIVIDNGQPAVAANYRHLAEDCTPSVYEAFEYRGFSSIEELRQFYAEFMSADFWEEYMRKIQSGQYNTGTLFEYNGKLYKAVNCKVFQWQMGAYLYSNYQHYLYSFDENGFTVSFATQGAGGYWPRTRFIFKDGLPYIQAIEEWEPNPYIY